MPHGCAVGETEMSCSPSSSSRTTSFRRIAGSTRNSPAPDPLQHGVAVPAQPEEVVALPGRDQLEGGVLDAVAVHDLTGCLNSSHPVQ